MTLQLFAHPFSSYSWKAQIALDEKGVAADYRSVEVPENGAALCRHWPLGKFPLLVDGDRAVFEATRSSNISTRALPARRG